MKVVPGPQIPQMDAITDSAVVRTLCGGEKLLVQLKMPERRTTWMLCYGLSVLAALSLILAYPGLDSLTRPIGKYYGAVKWYDDASLAQDELDLCQGRRIYMYDLPSAFNLEVLNVSRCNHSLLPWKDLCSRYVNGGYGVRLSDLNLSSSAMAVPSGNASGEQLFDQTDFYDTDSYTLEIIFHMRLKKYRCLTNQTALADVHYVPFYTGLLMLDYLYGAQKAFEKRATYGSEILAWLDQNGGEQWRRFGGRDHFLILGRTTWDFSIHPNWGTNFSSLPYVSNMTRLVLETGIRKNEQAIPYPTAFHPHSPERLYKWIENVKVPRRKYLFSYIGSPRPNNLTIRGIMGSSCINAGPSVCDLVDCSVVNCKDDPIAIYTSFLQSNFCLEPIGDTSTRRSTFDCLIAGAIPVFFSVSSAYTQYTWHLPEDRDSYSVYIAEKELRAGKSIHEVLASYSEERIQEMRRTIVSIIPNLVYNAYENGDRSAAPKDAFELSIQKVIERIAAVKES